MNEFVSDSRHNARIVIRIKRSTIATMTKHTFATNAIMRFTRSRRVRSNKNIVQSISRRRRRASGSVQHIRKPKSNYIVSLAIKRYVSIVRSNSKDRTVKESQQVIHLLRFPKHTRKPFMSRKSSILCWKNERMSSPTCSIRSTRKSSNSISLLFFFCSSRLEREVIHCWYLV